MAIHGFSRMHSWEVVETSDNRVHVRDEVHSDDHPYSYRLDQIIDIAPDGFRISLSIQNEGDSALPFGIGLHPWFSKTNKATLEFQSNGAPQLDTRGLPQGIPEAIDWFTPGNTIVLSKLSLVNCCFTGWNREATIRWPETSTGLRLKGEGALRHLHVFNPQDRAVFCAEPVSHLPDVINRPALGEDAAMTVLNPRSADGCSPVFRSSFARQCTWHLQKFAQLKYREGPEMTRKAYEDLRSARWMLPDDQRSSGHRSRTMQMGYDPVDWEGKPIIAIINTVGCTTLSCAFQGSC